jgi:hypothetical protein
VSIVVTGTNISVGKNSRNGVDSRWVHGARLVNLQIKEVEIGSRTIRLQIPNHGIELGKILSGRGIVVLARERGRGPAKRHLGAVSGDEIRRAEIRCVTGIFGVIDDSEDVLVAERVEGHTLEARTVCAVGAVCEPHN